MRVKPAGIILLVALVLGIAAHQCVPWLGSTIELRAPGFSITAIDLMLIAMVVLMAVAVLVHRPEIPRPPIPPPDDPWANDWYRHFLKEPQNDRRHNHRTPNRPGGQP